MDNKFRFRIALGPLGISCTRTIMANSLANAVEIVRMRYPGCVITDAWLQVGYSYYGQA